MFAPNQLRVRLQMMARESAEKLQSFFKRIKSVEVFLTEKDDKMVEIKLYLMHSMLYTAGHADGFEQALENALEKMRLQLLSYKKEIAIY